MNYFNHERLKPASFVWKTRENENVAHNGEDGAANDEKTVSSLDWLAWAISSIRFTAFHAPKED